MTRPSEPKHPVLRSVYWREEIIELVLWLRGEGFDERIDAGLLCRSFGLEREQATAHLERLRAHGYLQLLGEGRYGLAQAGEEEARRIRDTSRAMPMSASGGCGSGCWCETSPFEAACCAAQRSH